jgi:hypothetical protein
LPDGCETTAWRQLRDEWWLVWRVWLGRRSERERELAIVARQGGHAALHVLRSKGAIRAFLDQAEPVHPMGRAAAHTLHD